MGVEEPCGDGVLSYGHASHSPGTPKRTIVKLAIGLLVAVPLGWCAISVYHAYRERADRLY
jgi:hypothetical protein